MTLLLLLKICLVIFIVGNLLEMGLKLSPEDALKGLRNFRFVGYTLLWGFVLGPALAYALTLIIPLERPYAVGLILLGMAPSAPFLPLLVNKAKGDVGLTAAFMMLVAITTIIFMPLVVPLLAKGLSVSPWTIAKPLLIIILLPMVVGMFILRRNKNRAKKLNPIVKKVTGVFTVATVVLSVVVYGEGLLGVAGTFAIAAQIIFFGLLTTLSYWLSFGLKLDQRLVLSIGMSTRNLGAAIAPLLSIKDLDQRTVVMVVLGLPVMLIFTWFAVKCYGPPARKPETLNPATPKSA